MEIELGMQGGSVLLYFVMSCPSPLSSGNTTRNGGPGRLNRDWGWNGNRRRGDWLLRRLTSPGMVNVACGVQYPPRSSSWGRDQKGTCHLTHIWILYKRRLDMLRFRAEKHAPPTAAPALLVIRRAWACKIGQAQIKLLTQTLTSPEATPARRY